MKETKRQREKEDLRRRRDRRRQREMKATIMKTDRLKETERQRD